MIYLNKKHFYNVYLLIKTKVSIKIQQLPIKEIFQILRRQFLNLIKK